MTEQPEECKHEHLNVRMEGSQCYDCGATLTPPASRSEQRRLDARKPLERNWADPAYVQHTRELLGYMAEDSDVCRDTWIRLESVAGIPTEALEGGVIRELIGAAHVMMGTRYGCIFASALAKLKGE